MPSPDDLHLSYAEGFLQLGMLEDALKELSALSQTEATRPPALAMRGHCLLRMERWAEAVDSFDQLIRSAPRNPDGYLHKAYCLHELKQTAQAKVTLLSGSEVLRDLAVFHYNLACYECQLGQIHQAIKHLEEAFQHDESFRSQWKSDPDLLPLLPLHPWPSDK